EHLAGELGDVEGVVDDGRVLQAARVVDGVPVRAVHVHRDQGDGRLLLSREALEPAFERVFVASLADPEGLAGLEVTHDGHELVVERVASSEPLLVHADLSQGYGRPRRLPARDGLPFGATPGQPAQAGQGGGETGADTGPPTRPSPRGTRGSGDTRRAPARSAAPRSAPPTAGRTTGEQEGAGERPGRGLRSRCTEGATGARPPAPAGSRAASPDGPRELPARRRPTRRTPPSPSTRQTPESMSESSRAA